jgi:quercetin dioxygenase-like cupin family protein
MLRISRFGFTMPQEESITHPRMSRMRASQMMAVVLVGGAVAASCADGSPTDAETATGQEALAPAATLNSEPPPPIRSEALTARHRFTDDVAAQFRLKPEGRPREVINMQDASHMAVLRFTIQPGVRFPWHTHPGLVMVAVTQGELVFVYGDDCVERRYPAGTAFVDPGFGSIHYAFNPTGGETIIVASFLGVPATGPLTLAVAPAAAAALDAKCGVAAASHTH